MIVSGSRLPTKLELRTRFREDGMEHQAEGIIADALRTAKDSRILDWFKAFCTDASQPSFTASVCGA